jgi:recombination protein RecT
MANPDYVVTIYDQKIKERFLEVVDERTYNKEIIFAKQAFDNSDSLQKCSKDSMRNAIVNIALTGATLNPVMQQAFLIPRKGKVCLDFSYRGLAHIAVSSGGVVDLDAFVVYENDEFSYNYGLKPDLVHIPATNNRGAMFKVYAVAILPSGIRKFIVLDKEEIDAVKKSSVAFTKGSDSPWKGDFEAEMWRKTAIKKLYKLLPMTERMSAAVAVLNEHEGLDKTTKAETLVKKFEEKVETVECPDSESIIDKKLCDDCIKFVGCPAHEQKAA